ncbi:MAG: hypothetical protein AB7R40_22385 [Nitrospiraceae bacterium]
MATKKEERLVDLHTYICVDGVCRTRCREHIPSEGPYRPLMRAAFTVKRRVLWSRCIECFYEHERLKEAEKEDDDEQATELTR